MESNLKVTRGVRNNNPFNIKRSQIVWKGELPFSHCSDPVFEQFETMDFGLRAGIKLLMNYVRKGYNTPQKIISRFAPSSENDVKSYLDFLYKEGYIKSVDDIISISTLGFYNLLCGILYFESRFVINPVAFSRILKTM